MGEKDYDCRREMGGGVIRGELVFQISCGGGKVYLVGHNVVVSSEVGIEAVFMEMLANKFAPFMGKLFRKGALYVFSMASEGYSFFFFNPPWRP